MAPDVSQRLMRQFFRFDKHTSEPDREPGARYIVESSLLMMGMGMGMGMGWNGMEIGMGMEMGRDGDEMDPKCQMILTHFEKQFLTSACETEDL